MGTTTETRITSTQAKDAIYKAHSISSSASEIDGNTTSNNILKFLNAKILDINDLFTFSKDGFYNELILPNPYPTEVNQPVHLSIAKSEKIFNRYKYWIAYTPYPKSNSDFENPCVVATNDFKTFAEPSLNPLVSKPSGGYNADTHLVFNDDFSKLYLLFRVRANGTNRLKVMETIDGETWTQPVEIFTGTIGISDFASPSCWFKNGKWHIIYHNLDAAIPKPMYKVESVTSDIYGAYTSPTLVSIPLSPNGANLGWWHSFFNKVSDSQIIGIVQDNSSSGSPGELYFVQSFDNGISFDLCNRKITLADGYYRSTFFRENNELVVIPSTLYRSIKLFKCGLGFLNEFNNYTNNINSYLSNPSFSYPNILLLDTFNRVDSTTLGFSDNGKTYSYSGGTFSIKDNTAVASSDGAKALFDTNSNNYKILTKMNTSSSTQQWIIIRGVDNSNFVRIGTGGTGRVIYIQEIVGSVVSKEYNTFILTPSSFSIEINCRGVLMTLSINGEVGFTVNLSTLFRDAKIVGFQSKIGVASSFDYLIVTK